MTGYSETRAGHVAFALGSLYSRVLSAASKRKASWRSRNSILRTESSATEAWNHYEQIGIAPENQLMRTRVSAGFRSICMAVWFLAVGANVQADAKQDRNAMAQQIATEIANHSFKKIYV